MATEKGGVVGGLWLFDAVINEFRGWRRFREATGRWPVCSILASIFSIPLLLGMGLLCFVATLTVGILSLAVSALFVLVVGATAAWWGFAVLPARRMCGGHSDQGEQATRL